MSVYVVGSNLTLDDLCQLQSLLSHEHEKREKYVVDHHRLHNHHVHHQLHFRHAMTPAVAKREQERLRVALEHLKVLKEQYRRRRALQIQVYLENFRRQQLIRTILQEEEELYYRQCISAALEQRRVNAIYHQYLLQRQYQLQQQQQQQQQLMYFKDRLLQKEEEQEDIASSRLKQEEPTYEEEEEEEEGYSQYHSQLLAELLKQIFDHQPVYDSNESDTENDIADLWNYVLNTPGEEKPSYQFEMPMTERGTPSPVPHLVSQDPVTDYVNRQEKAYDETNKNFESLQPPPLEKNKVVKEKEEEQRELEKEADKKEREVEEGFEESERELQPSNLKDAKNKQLDDMSEESDTESLPPLQDHVLTLQDLINKLSSEPVMVGEQYVAPEPVKKKFQYADLQSSDKDIPKFNIDQSNLDDKDEDESPATFMPQNIITEAEPTPTIEQPVPDIDKEISDFVDSVAAEQKQGLSFASTTDSLHKPRKSAHSESFIQSDNGERRQVDEADIADQQDKFKAPDQINITENISKNQQQQQQHQNEAFNKNESSSAKSEYLHEGKPSPKEEEDQRIPASFSPPKRFTNSANNTEVVKDRVEERDPAKQHLYEQLDEIENKLNSSDMKTRWEKVLQSDLTFSKQGGGTLLLSTSTQADREFLGLEDELVRVMLKLDSIISDGDEKIRDYRRTLVKQCERMLDRLDQHKQKEWEKVVAKTHHHNRRKHRHHSHKKENLN